MSVKRSLTPKRRREREIPDYAQMVRRIIRAHGRRCAAADPEDLVGLVEMHQSVDEAVAEAVAGLRASGFSWSQIARPLGITRQAAQMRFATHAPRPRPMPGQIDLFSASESAGAHEG